MKKLIILATAVFLFSTVRVLAQSGTVPFIITVKTDNAGASNNDQFTLPLLAGETYNFTAEFDGQTVTHAVSSDLTLTFPSGPGTYDISITGTFPGLQFLTADDPGKIINVKQWGNTAWTMMRYAFEGCVNLDVTATDAPDLSGVTDVVGVFYGCTSLVSPDVSQWDVTTATDISYMFYNCQNLTSLDVSNWNVANVTNMHSLFSGCIQLTAVDVSNWNVGNVTDMAGLFSNCNVMTSPDVSGWDVSKVTAMNGMFYRCREITTLDVATWDVSNVTTMEGMFQGCIAMTSYIGIENWNVAAVTNMSATFRFNLQLQSLNLTGWNTGNVTDMSWMFYRCYSLTELLGYESWDVSKVTDFWYTFERVELPTMDISSWNTTDALTDMTYMFASNKATEVIGLENLDVTNVRWTSGMFQNSYIIVPTTQYDALLIAWDQEVLAPKSSPVYFTINSRYTAGGAAETARASLISKNWNITDLGPASGNTSPVAGDDSVSLAKNAPHDITLIGSDADGDLIHYIIIDAPVNGSLTGRGADLTYTPTTDYIGADSFTFQTYDGTDYSSLATVTIDVFNNTPTADDQSVVIFWNTPTPITLTSTDDDSDPLSYSIVSTPANGSVALVGDQATYTPNPDFLGADSFTFKVNDGFIDSDVATISITVYSNTPVPDDQSQYAYEDVPVDITLTATNYSGSPITYAVVTLPANGTLTGTPPSLEYIADTGFFGTDTFTFTATSDGETSGPATITMNVGPALVARYNFDDAGNPWNDSSTYSNHGTAYLSPTITTGDVGSGVELSGANYVVVPDNGPLDLKRQVTVMAWVWLNDETGDQDLLQKGTNYGFFEIRGGDTPKNVLNIGGGWNTYTYSQAGSFFTGGWHHVAMTYDGATVKNYVDAVEDGSFPQTGIMSTNSDPLGLGINAPWYNAGLKGIVDDVRIYGRALTPDEIIGIFNHNAKPTAYDQSVTVAKGGTGAITLTATDLDSDTLTFAIVDPPLNGVLTGLPPAVSYSPAPGFDGTDTFTFTADDGVEPSNVATVTITVPDPPPVIDSEAMASPSTIRLGETVDLSVFASDPEAEPLTFTWSKLTGTGTITFSANGTTLSNQTVASFSAADVYEIQVTITDGSSSITSSVTVTVDPNAQPTVESQTLSVHWSDDLPITLVGSDQDSGDSLTYSVTTWPTGGVLTGTGASRLYRANTEFKGADAFEFTASDGALASTPATVTVEVTNTLPVANAFSAETRKNKSVDITLSGNDIDGDSLSFTIDSAFTNGALTGTAPNLIYTPNQGYTGTDIMTYVVSDGLDDSSVATVEITVKPTKSGSNGSSGCAIGANTVAHLLPCLILLVTLSGLRRRY